MNAERLHVIALAIRDDLTHVSAISSLNSIVQALQNQIQQPAQPSYQQQVSDNLMSLSKALSEAMSNTFSPSWKQAVQELGFKGLLGNELQGKITEIFSRNQITPSIALQELKEIFNNLKKLSAAIEQLISSFETLEIGAEELEAGQCEIGVLIPRIFLDSKLENFSKELLELNKILNPFAELVTQKREGFNIRNISSSDFGVSLAAIPSIAACLAVAIERIVTLYDKLLDIKKKHADLKNLGLQEKELKGIDDHANSLMEKGIKELIPQLIKSFWKGKDDGRKHELEIELRTALNKIANRIDKGFNIEIRAEPLSEEGVEEEGLSESSSPGMEHIKTIQTAARNIKYFKAETSPLLSLPETDEEGGKKKK